jgi:hypothetical protein
MIVYQIKISGELDTLWTEWLNNMKRSTAADESGKPITVLTGPLADQSELRGLLIKIWDLNLELISINRLDSISLHERNHP